MIDHSGFVMAAFSPSLQNIGDLLGQFRSSFSIHADGRRITANFRLSPELVADAVSFRWIVTALAGAACDRGMLRDAADSAARLTEEKSIFFDSSTGDGLRAEATELYRSNGNAIWRASIFRGPVGSPERWPCIAELTQTWSFHPASSARDNVVVALDVASEVRGFADRGAISRRAGTEERRSQVLKAAYKVISQRGYANASMREIAQTANLPIATVYLYIKSKEDLLFQISAVLLGDMKDQFRKEMGRHASPTDTLKQAIDRYLAYCGKNRRFINLVYREGKSLSEDNRQKILDLDRSFVQLWEEIIVAGKKAGEFDVKNPELIANYIYFLCSSWPIRHWNLKRFGERAVSETITDFSLRALGVSEVRTRK
jgi:AcrR family transcriptional regulator